MKNITLIAIIAATALIATSAILPYQIAALSGSTQPTQENEPVNAPKITSAASTPALTNVFVMPSNNLMTSKSYHTVAFTTAFVEDPANPGNSIGINTIELTYPAGFVLTDARVVEMSGCDQFPSDHCSGLRILQSHISGQTLSVDFGLVLDIPSAGQQVLVAVDEIVNGSTLNNQVAVTTRDKDGNVIQGPTLSAVFQLQRVTTEMLRNSAVTTLKIKDGNVMTPDIADSAVTGSKIANNAITLSKLSPSFMKFVQLHDDAAGNAKGWVPAGDDVPYTISDPDVKIDSFVVAQVVGQETFTDCVEVPSNGTLLVRCFFNPAVSGDTLEYIVIYPP